MRLRFAPRRNMSLRLALYLFILNGFILIVNSTAGYSFTRDVIKQNTAYYAEHYIGSLNNELNFYFQDLDLMTMSLFYTNPGLFRGLSQTPRQTEMRHELEGLRSGRKYVQDIIVMSNDLEAAGTSSVLMDQLQQADIYRRLMASSGEIVVSPTGYSTFTQGELLDSRQPVLFVGRKIVSAYDQVEGYVIVTLKAERITEITQNSEQRYDERLFLVDRKGILMEPTSSGELPHNGLEMLKLAGRGEPTVSRHGHMIVTGNDPEMQPLNIVGIIPEQALLKDASILLKLQLALNVVLLIIGSTLAFLLSYSFLRPVVKLAYFMKKLGNSRLIPYHTRSGSKDEVSFLIISFNRMIQRLERSARQLEKEREKQKKAELRALQAQINPHFIFNTLNNIRWQARMGRTGDIFDMLTSMNIILVSAFQLEKPIITVAEEIKLLEAYVNIQQQIHPGRFQVVYELDEAALDGKIARMSLQPLVENAIFHGVLPRKAPGTIHIRSEANADCVKLQITDSGIGAELSGLTEKHSDDEEAREHIGMHNVDKRIQLYFGAPYGVEWVNMPGAGMKVTVTLPWQYMIPTDSGRNSA